MLTGKPAFICTVCTVMLLSWAVELGHYFLREIGTASNRYRCRLLALRRSRLSGLVMVVVAGVGRRGVVTRLSMRPDSRRP